MQQVEDLFDWLSDNRSMLERYKEWDENNPEFYPLFCRFAKQLIDRGHRNIGVALIFERIRWESLIRTHGEPFKLNNNYRSFYARRFMRDYPQYSDLFRLREMEVEPDPADL